MVRSIASAAKYESVPLLEGVASSTGNAREATEDHASAEEGHHILELLEKRSALTQSGHASKTMKWPREVFVWFNLERLRR